MLEADAPALLSVTVSWNDSMVSAVTEGAINVGVAVLAPVKPTIWLPLICCQRYDVILLPSGS